RRLQACRMKRNSTRLETMTRRVGIIIRSKTTPGVLHELTGAIARAGGNIISVEITGADAATARIYLELELTSDPAPLIADMRGLLVVESVDLVTTLTSIYGKRVIIMGGGAQVGQVAIGAISEADRHNI